MKYPVSRTSTMFLRVVIGLISLIVLTVCMLVLPGGIMSDNGDYLPIFIGMHLPAITFFVGAYQAFKLLGYIDKGKVFTMASVKALRYIKYCGGIISALYALLMPYIFAVADREDAPGVALLGLIFTFAPFAVAVAAAVLAKQLKKAIDIKSENDLTV